MTYLLKAEYLIIKIEKQDSSPLGMHIVSARHSGTKNVGIYVSHIVPGSIIANDGRISVGDQLISVNDASLVGIDQESACETIRCAGNTLRFELLKDGARLHGIEGFKYSQYENLKDENFLMRKDLVDEALGKSPPGRSKILHSHSLEIDNEEPKTMFISESPVPQDKKDIKRHPLIKMKSNDEVTNNKTMKSVAKRIVKQITVSGARHAKTKQLLFSTDEIDQEDMEIPYIESRIQKREKEYELLVAAARQLSYDGVIRKMTPQEIEETSEYFNQMKSQGIVLYESRANREDQKDCENNSNERLPPRPPVPSDYLKELEESQAQLKKDYC